MKKITVLFSLLGIALMAVAQEQEAGDLNTGTAATPVTIRIRCSPGISPLERPLFVVDGVPLDTADINKIRPELIESVYILKDAQAKAIYGCRAMGGVVIINLRPRRVYIKVRNSYTGEPVPAAKLEVKIDRQQNSIRRSSGETVEVSSYHNNTELEISAAGYAASRHLISKGSSDTLFVLLEPVAQLLPEVIVKGVQHTQICSYTIRCGVAGVSICSLSITDNTGNKDAGGMGVVPAARLYPNPAASGSRLNIQLPSAVSGKVSISLYGLNGQLIKQVVDKSNTGQLVFLLPPAFRGVGILLTQDESKSIISKEKIVIQ